MADLAILVLAMPNELYHLWQHYPWTLGQLACDIKVEWSTLIGPDPSRYSALIGGQVYAITTHLKPSKMPLQHFVPFSVLLWHDKWCIL